MSDHALLSPSSASRWLACTPSARLEEPFANTSSTFAAEGKVAHQLSEFILRDRYAMAQQIEFEEIISSEYYNGDMLKHCTDYADFVIEHFNGALAHTSDARIYLEQRLDFSEFVPEGFGTGDVVIVADRVCTLIDLKYGKGVAVHAENNKQLKLYALGVLASFDYMYDIQTVKVIIYQPRLDSVTEWEISVSDLLDWARTELVPKAKLAWAGEGEFQVGDHCMFCRAKPVCKALADHNMSLARLDFASPDLMGPEDISDVLSKSTLFLSWIKAVEEYALDQAVNNATSFPGYKLVEGRSNRVITDEDKAKKILLNAGYAPRDITTEPKLVSLTALEKLVGKKTLPQLFGSILIKPSGKPTLVPESDKREEFNSAAVDFAAEIEN